MPLWWLSLIHIYGSEDEKGTDFTKGTFCLLKHLEERGALPFKFVGNVEGHDLFEPVSYTHLK